MNGTPDHAAIAHAADLLAASRSAVVLAGAGMSKESGIPTYRGEGGLWTRLGEPPPTQYEVFAADPAAWWRRRLEDARHPGELAAALEDAEPNAGHRALAALEALDVVHHVITQNVDDLHRRAGQRSITEIHGNRHWLRCVRCGARWPRERFEVDPSSLPPRCAEPDCDGVVKSDTVMFGEPIPARALNECEHVTGRADCFMTVGTSGVVYPAARYPLDAWNRGVPLIEVNPEQTPISRIATVTLRAPSGVALPALLEAVRERRADGRAAS